MKARIVLWSVALGLLVATSAARADSVFNFDPFLVTAPDSRNFGNSSTPDSTPADTLVPGTSPPNFLDYWSFQLANTAAIGSFVGSINFTDGFGGTVTQGIRNLELRLVGPGGTVIGNGGIVNLPVIPAQQQIFSVVAPSGYFNPGLYRLEVGGELVGPTSSYAGTLNAVPAAVPLPAALPLLVAGLGLMGFVGRRRLSRSQLAGLRPEPVA